MAWARRWQGAWYASGPSGALRKAVLKRGSSRIDQRYSLGSMVAAATRAAAARSDSATSVGYSRRSIIEHVGLMASTLAPAPTNGPRIVRFRAAADWTAARSPFSHAGMPQQESPAAQRTSTWLASRTESVSRPISGALFWT